jgi:hypothetical protein
MSSERETIENRAKEALKKFNPEAKNINVFDVVPNFLGSTLVLLEFNDSTRGRKPMMTQKSGACW